MAIQTSFPKIADQIISYNKNIIDVLAKINSIATSTEPTVTIDVVDENGGTRSFTIPTNTSLRADIERLNANINSLYSIDATGSLIQTSNDNKFKKIITVDLNREPISVSNLNSVERFKTSPNWFFDSMLDPMLNVEFDLSGKVENNVRKCLVRRYIVDFARDENGELTNLGVSFK